MAIEKIESKKSTPPAPAPIGNGNAAWKPEPPAQTASNGNAHDRSSLSVRAYLPDPDKLHGYLEQRDLVDPAPASAFHERFEAASQMVAEPPTLREVNLGRARFGQAPLSDEQGEELSDTLERRGMEGDPTALVSALTLVLHGQTPEQVDQALGQMEADNRVGALDLGFRLPANAPLDSRPGTQNSTVPSPNSTFVTQFNDPTYNPGGPNSSANCGPASVTMALANLGLLPPGLDYTKGESSPEATIEAIRQRGTGNGSDIHSFTNIAQMKAAAESAGATTRDVRNIDDVIAALQRGDQVVLAGNPNEVGAYGVGHGINYSGGHFINVCGMDTNFDPPRFIVQDPLSHNGTIVIEQSQLVAYMAADNATGREGFSVGNPNGPHTPLVMDSTQLGQPGTRTNSSQSYPPGNSTPASGNQVMPQAAGSPAAPGVLASNGLGAVNPMIAQGQFDQAITQICSAILQRRSARQPADDLTQVLLGTVAQALAQNFQPQPPTRQILSATLGFEPFGLMRQMLAAR